MDDNTPDLSSIADKSELDDILAHCIVDIKSTCGIIFPEIFYSPFSTLHQQIFDLINSGHKKIAIAAPRGIGKTSIARAVVMRSILFHLHNFIVYLSNSATSAEMQTENIKRDLLSNSHVRSLFGNIKEAIGSDKEMDESFSKSAWTAYGDCFILPRGAGQQVRGLNWSNFRPQLVIIDDLEDKNEIRSEENRKKLKEWFHSDLMKTEDRYSKGCIFIYIDTVKHEDSLLVDLLNSPEWASVQLSICDDDYKSLDPNYMTDEEIKAEVDEHRRLGTLDAFYMERMNVPISREDAVFKQEYFRYFDDFGDKLKVLPRTNVVSIRPGAPFIPTEDSRKVERERVVPILSAPSVKKEMEEGLLRTYNMLHITIVDPARTVKLQSADSAVITIAIDRTDRKIFLRDLVSRKFYPDELYDEMFRQVKTFSSFILGYDDVGLSNFITQPIENECRVRSLHPMLIALPARRSKEERVATLAPLYRLGYIYHNKNNCGKLEGQLLGFPRSKLWDLMDALAYISYILDKHAVFFDPGDESDESPPDDEYDMLEMEKAMNAEEMGLII